MRVRQIWVNNVSLAVDLLPTSHDCTIRFGAGQAALAANLVADNRVPPAYHQPLLPRDESSIGGQLTDA